MEHLFADFTALVAHTQRHMEDIVDAFVVGTKKLGLKININKIEGMLAFQPAPHKVIPPAKHKVIFNPPLKLKWMAISSHSYELLDTWKHSHNRQPS